MPRFRYRALDGAGAMTAGEVEGADARAAVAAIRALGRLPVEVAPVGGGGLMALLNTEITPRDALSAGDRRVFTRALGTLLGAGLPLDRALRTVRDLGESRPARVAAGRLLEAVSGGASLSAAMGRDQAAFPPGYRSLVRAGEAGAALDAALARLADAEEAAAKRRGALRAALIYPAFLTVAAIGSVAVLLTVVVPTFEPMLADAGATPPAATRIVMTAGRIASAWWPAALAALALAGGAAAALLAREGPRRAWHRALLRLPLLGPLRRKMASALMARVLGELLRGGVPLPEALRLTRDGMTDRAFAAELDHVAPKVEAGAGLAGPLAKGGLPSPLALQLIAVGEESGALPAMLGKTADILDDEAQAALARLLATLTPTLTLAMGGLIALIVSSILFALFSINELALDRP